MNEIYNRFRSFVVTEGLIQNGDKILLSLSAGKDSMFMFHLIRKLQDEIDFSISVFHLNHLTRGEETDKDETFVKELCGRMKVRCYIEQYDFQKNRINGISFEEQAREVRYSILRRLCITDGYTKIATAHNMNDNAETILMRVLSGTGISGIRGIIPLKKNIIRPVLFADKNEIYRYLEENNLQWREDESNYDNTYLRNYLRNEIIPSLKKRFPHAEENLVMLSGHAVENQNLIANLADKLYPDTVINTGSETVIIIEQFSDNIPLIKYYISIVLSEYYGMKTGVAIFKEIIKRYGIKAANMILYEKDNILIRKCLIGEKKAIRITEKGKDNAVIKEWEYLINVDTESSTRIDEINKELVINHVDYSRYLLNKDRRDIIFIQPETEINHIIIRNRRAGDRIKLETGSRKIKEIMIEKKLDSKVKNCIPLIVADNQIAAYLPGIVNSNNNRVACNFHIRNDTKRILAFFFRDY